MIVAPVSAQNFYPPAQAVDISNLATNAALASVTATATAAQTAAASACQPMATVPPMEAVGGSPGSGTNCRLANSVQPRITRVVPFITGAGGTVAVTWADMGAVPGVMPVGYATSTATAFPKCAPVIGTITSTGATIKCTMPFVTVGVLGTSTSIIDTPTSGISGTVFAIPNS